MAILGLGTDIVEVDRIAKAIERTGERFAQRILTEREYQYFTQSGQPVRYLAKRFAAKEAAAKALGTGIAAGISFQHFEVSNDDAGKPVLVLTDKAGERAAAMGASHLHLSISDERHFAVATVILES
ncbi:holo-ACP synthase [Corallincola platygyrae]|uniref:Holo-[acyl-carrier-protein] synthase n=1 Tax=Corallincola platygyrae TaxID=1193278 RepID=A0ABW4XL64_9GAMM